jgi:hypothetical protein
LLKVLNKLMAVESLVFAPLFATHGGTLQMALEDEWKIYGIPMS